MEFDPWEGLYWGDKASVAFLGSKCHPNYQMSSNGQMSTRNIYGCLSSPIRNLSQARFHARISSNAFFEITSIPDSWQLFLMLFFQRHSNKHHFFRFQYIRLFRNRYFHKISYSKLVLGQMVHCHATTNEKNYTQDWEKVRKRKKNKGKLYNLNRK